MATSSSHTQFAAFGSHPSHSYFDESTDGSGSSSSKHPERRTANKNAICARRLDPCIVTRPQWKVAGTRTWCALEDANGITESALSREATDLRVAADDGPHLSSDGRRRARPCDVVVETRMRSEETSVDVLASPERIFDLLHDYARRLEWDPFLRRAIVIDGDAAGLHVRTLCVAKWSSGGLGMETEYVSFTRPNVAAVRMTSGPWFFGSFAASIRQQARSEGLTRVTYRYNFEVRPRWLSPVLEPVLRSIFMRETRQRLTALKAFLERSNPIR
jgi:hypothetical protein